MAAQIVPSVIKWAAEKVSSLLSSSTNPPSSVQQELHHLQTILLKIEATLEEAEEKKLNSEAEKLRLSDLKEVAYNAEDVMDEYQYELLRATLEGPGSNMDFSEGKIDVYSRPVMVSVPVELSVRLRHIAEQFSEVTKEWDSLNSLLGDRKRRRIQPWAPPETSSLYDASSHFCREAEKERLVELLLSDEDSFSVLPVVGMGGIGKTTLVQRVFHDVRICQYFDKRGWVFVSENFDILGLIKKIIMSVSGRNFTQTRDLDRLWSILRDELKGKRLLLILDDVWNEDPALWQSLKSPFLGIGHCKIVVTARNESVAAVVGTVGPFRLDCLSFDECLILFTEHAFRGVDTENVEVNMLSKVEKIVAKCKGLPLAVKVLGAALCGAEDDLWTDALESEVWELDEEKEQILPALKLSYDRAPTEVKRCFLYLSLFPRGFFFRTGDVVSLWMSQGLLRPLEGEEMEDVGAKYVAEMLRRSLVERKETCIPYGGDFVMHDLIYDLLQSVTEGECLRIEAGELCGVPSRTRHMSVILTGSEKVIGVKSLVESRRLRTLMTIRNDLMVSVGTTDVLSEVIRSLKCVRTLDLSNTSIGELHSSVRNLKSLRYLRLTRTKITKLPDSICTLYNLQTLILDDTHLTELPESIGNLVNLRHLSVVDSYMCMPRGIGRLRNLQSFPIFFIGKGSWHCSIGQLRSLSNIKGRLYICGLENVLQEDVFHHETFLKSNTHISHLALRWDSCCSTCEHTDKSNEPRGTSKGAACSLIPDGELGEWVLDALEPHSGIEVLDITSYPSAKFPKWVSDRSFDKLTILIIFCMPSNFTCKALPTLGQLPSLKNLSIYGMAAVESIGAEFYACGESAERAFRSLEKLEFGYMDELAEWSEPEDGAVGHITELTLKSCPKLGQLPGRLLSSLTSLFVDNCAALGTLPLLSSLTSLELLHQWKPEILASSHFPLLNYVHVYGFNGASVVFDSRNLPSVEKVEIENCEELVSVRGLFELSRLEVLKILKCPEIRLSLSEEMQSSLKDVQIVASPEAENWFKEQCGSRKRKLLCEEEEIFGKKLQAGNESVGN